MERVDEYQTPLIHDAIRHAVTKLSALHFVACEEFARRVVQLGEQPQHVFTVGALGIDAIRRIELLGRAELEADLGIDLKKPVVMITYHPATLGKLTPAAAADAQRFLGSHRCCRAKAYARQY